MAKHFFTIATRLKALPLYTFLPSYVIKYVSDIVTNWRAVFCKPKTVMADKPKRRAERSPPSANSYESCDLSNTTDCVRVLLKLLAEFGNEVGYQCLNHKLTGSPRS